MPDHEVLDAVEDVSGGIPAFALDLLRDRGLDRLLAGEPAPVPPAVQAIAERRLTHVATTDPDVLPHLRVAAVLGDRIAPDVVASVAPPSEIPVQDLLRRASESRLVHCTASGAWRFTPGARDALAAGVANEEAARLHRTAADLLTENGAVLPGAAARVARHLLSAAELGDEAGPDAVAWALRATDEALRNGDARTAARLCGRSLALVSDGDLATRAPPCSSGWGRLGGPRRGPRRHGAPSSRPPAPLRGPRPTASSTRRRRPVSWPRPPSATPAPSTWAACSTPPGAPCSTEATAALRSLRPDALGRSSTNAAPRALGAARDDLGRRRGARRRRRHARPHGDRTSTRRAGARADADRTRRHRGAAPRRGPTPPARPSAPATCRSPSSPSACTTPSASGRAIAAAPTPPSPPSPGSPPPVTSGSPRRSPR